jgi:S-DNA-T family DNA segregation ATPase FtsK/SpoIIIE
MTFALWTLLGALGNRTLAGGTWRWGGWLGNIFWPPLRRGMGPVGLPVLLGLLMVVAALILAPAVTRALVNMVARWFGTQALPWLKPLPLRGGRTFLAWAGRPIKALSEGRAPQELDARDAEEFFQQEERRKADEALVAALDRAEREAAQFRRSNIVLPPEAAFPNIHSMNLDEESWSAPDTLLAEAPGVVDTSLPGPRLLRDAAPLPVKPLLVQPVTGLDGFGRVVNQPSLGLTEPTPKAPLPDWTPSQRLDVPSMDLDTPAAQRQGKAAADGHIVPWATTPPRRPTRSDAAPARPPRPEAPPDPPRARSARVPAAHPPEPPRAGEDSWGPADRLELPPRRLFDPPRPEERLDPALLEATRALIQQKLTEFKVKGNVVGLQPGPVVTVYEFQPDPGVPLAKILGMEEDLALGLQAEKVRIDRIPGRNLVGIEVPNPRREVISFREVVDSPVFRDPSHKDARSLLTLALGKDISGKPVVADLAKMPHLLIGGSTGSGKSVGVNAMICSLLLRALPGEVKLILVDPKMVELGIYEDIPHLWAPVVTDMKEAGRVLKWVVAQMEDRYRRLALLSVRNLEGFNTKLIEAGGSVDLSDRTPNPRWPDRPLLLEPLPYVVVVIDELADLMMVARSEVEDSIARIAQKARAVGIHLILATQRPSVDIVTGVIKANLPSRLSYRVNTKIDSRTILDSGGGEQLLGKGDALFLAPGNARPHRIHAPFLTEDETLRLVDWLKERGRPDYNNSLISAMETDDETQAVEGPEESGGGDDLYERAVAVVKRERKASTSLLQRKLNIGYGRAARVIDRMEEEGIIGPDRGAGKPRDVLTDEG